MTFLSGKKTYIAALGLLISAIWGPFLALISGVGSRQAAKIEAQRNSLQETLSNVKKDKHTMDQLSRMSNANRKRLRNRYTTSK